MDFLTLKKFYSTTTNQNSVHQDLSHLPDEQIIELYKILLRRFHGMHKTSSDFYFYSFKPWKYYDDVKLNELAMILFEYDFVPYLDLLKNYLTPDTYFKIFETNIHIYPKNTNGIKKHMK